MNEQPRITELLDKVGWMPKEDNRYPYAVFQWMTEITNQLLELQHRVDTLEYPHGKRS